MLYYHNKDGIRFTAAISLPTKAELIQMLAKSQDFVALGIGMTFVHPKENFKKDRGRELAASRAHTYKFNVSGIQLKNGRTTFMVSQTATHRVHGKISIQVTFSTVGNSSNVHLEKVEVLSG